MKKIILLILLYLGITNLSAQQQKDSILLNKIPTILNDLSQQRLEIEEISKKQNETISELVLQREVLNDSINKLHQLIQWNSQNIEDFSKELRNKNLTIMRLQSDNQRLDSEINGLNELIKKNGQDILTNSNELDSKIQEAGKKTDSQISKLDVNLGRNQLYWIIATIATLLLGVLIYWLLWKRINANKEDVETQIRNTKASLEEESVKLDNKLVEVLETQLKLQQETIKSEPVVSNEEVDHSLALKVADEILRMQKNISKMGNDTKGLKPLLKGIERIQNNLAANGYDMINYLNKPYDERYDIEVIRFITDENLEEGTRIITAVIKPQINYKNELIQKAEVDVSQN